MPKGRGTIYCLAKRGSCLLSRWQIAIAGKGRRRLGRRGGRCSSLGGRHSSQTIRCSTLGGCLGGCSQRRCLRHALLAPCVVVCRAGDLRPSAYAGKADEEGSTKIVATDTKLQKTENKWRCDGLDEQVAKKTPAAHSKDSHFTRFWLRYGVRGQIAISISTFSRTPARSPCNTAWEATTRPRA